MILDVHQPPQNLPILQKIAFSAYMLCTNHLKSVSFCVVLCSFRVHVLANYKFHVLMDTYKSYM